MTRNRLLRIAAAVTTAFGLAATTAAPAAATPPGPDATAERKIDSRIAQQTARAGSTTFWVLLDDRADLTGAHAIDDWAERGRVVHDTLRAHAARTQAPVAAELTRSGATVRSYWAANALLVTGGMAAARTAAARADVAEVVATTAIALPPTDARPAGSVTADDVEWGVAEVGAPRVWDEFGTRGEGVTVGVIDSGVDATHPALAASYRGAQPGGAVSHDHNWFDPTGLCGGAGPCDNNGHGTHVTGTVAGDGGEGARIGVAPGARWVAAKGCELDTCSDAALLASMQWMLAPTRADGTDPRPDLRPHVVNNSWGNANGALTTFRQVVQAWAAAGVFSVFSNGNSGPACGTAGAPASYPEGYAVGAYDPNGAIAWFSSRGASPLDGGVKPDVSAPGVTVRSSLPGGAYGYGDGTSMAAPHVSGAVALVLSAAPGLAGDLATIRDLLDSTARDADDTSCGGTPVNNNVFGEGRLSARDAVASAPRGPIGTITGTVTDSAGAPVAGARVAVTTGEQTRRATTGADGAYRLVVSAGAATVTVSAFGFTDAVTGADVAAGATVTVDATLDRSPAFTVSGTVRTPDGAPVAGVRVAIENAPLPAVVTDAAGAYSLAGVPGGTHTLVSVSTPCATGARVEITVAGDTRADLTASPAIDAKGYGCRLAEPRWEPTTAVLPITGEAATTTVELPFVFTLYGKATRQLRVSVDGRIATDGRFVSDDIMGTRPAGPIPDSIDPAGSIYPFWSDLFVDPQASVRVGHLGSAPNRAVVIEWREARLVFGAGERVTAQAVLGEDGTVRFQYRGLDTAAEQGAGVTPTVVGIEDETSTVASQYLYSTPLLSDSTAIVYSGPPSSAALVTVVDAVDGRPIDANRDPRVEVRTAAGALHTTLYPDLAGRVGFAAPPGAYTVTPIATNYVAAPLPVTVPASGVAPDTVARVATGRPSYGAWSYSFTAPAGGAATRDLTVTNTGTAPLQVWIPIDTWQGDPAWMSVVGPASQTLAPGRTGTFVIRASAATLGVGHHTGRIRVYSDGGRLAESGGYVSVDLTVPGYGRGVDVGGAGVAPAYAADRPYTPSAGYGYTGNRTSIVTTTREIAGTDADALYRTARSGDHGYRFTGLPNGAHTVRLEFAEIEGARAGDRRFDVAVNGARKLAGLDVAAIAGANTALTRTITVQVTNGEVRVDLTRNGGRRAPLLAAVTVEHRPDLTGRAAATIARRAL